MCGLGSRFFLNIENGFSGADLALIGDSFWRLSLFWDGLVTGRLKRPTRGWQRFACCSYHPASPFRLPPASAGLASSGPQLSCPCGKGLGKAARSADSSA